MKRAAKPPEPREVRKSVADLLDERAMSDVAEIVVGAGATGEVSAEGRIDLAQRALERGRPHHALLHLEAAEALAPDTRGLAKTFGRALLGVGMPAEALERFERAVIQDPEDRETWRLIAALREQRGDQEGAVDASLLAMLLAPDHAPGSGPSGEESRSHHSRPVPRASRLRADAPVRDSGPRRDEPPPSSDPASGSRRSPAQVLSLADALVEAGSVRNAEKLFARHLKGPLGARAHLGLARCACARGQYSQALPHLRAAQRLEPGNPDLRAAIHALLAAMAE